MSGRSANARLNLAKAAGNYFLSPLLAMTVCGGIQHAFGAAVPPRSDAPVVPVSASNPPSLEIPAEGAVRGVPSGSRPRPDATPLPAPAPTNHYASPGGKSFFEGPPGGANASY